MPHFNPDAATAAYLATLTPAEHARAISYTQGGEWLVLWGWLVAVIAAVLVLRSGVLVRVRDRIGGPVSRPNLTVIGCTLVFILLDWLIELPWVIYSDWWRESSYDLSNQSFMDWLGENAMSMAISAIFIVLLALAIFALMRRAPRTWWAWSGGVAVITIIILVLVSPVFIEPLFNDYKPAPPGHTRDAVVELAHRTGVPSDKILIYDGSRQSERYTANVSGMFGTARVAMSDTVFKQGADLTEVRAVVGHEMGHYARGHLFLLAGEFGVLALVCFWLANRLFRWILARAGGKAGATIGGISDPAGIPVIAITIATLGLVTTPITNSFTRFIENDADRFSLLHAHEPDGLARALVKTIAYRASSPSVLEETLFYDHPSVERRIHRAMVWKAEHPDLIGK